MGENLTIIATFVHGFCIARRGCKDVSRMPKDLIVVDKDLIVGIAFMVISSIVSYIQRKKKKAEAERKKQLQKEWTDDVAAAEQEPEVAFAQSSASSASEASDSEHIAQDIPSFTQQEGEADESKQEVVLELNAQHTFDHGVQVEYVSIAQQQSEQKDISSIKPEEEGSFVQEHHIPMEGARATATETGTMGYDYMKGEEGEAESEFDLRQAIIYSTVLERWSPRSYRL